MIAYDFDGVIVNDILFDGEQVDDVLRIRTHNVLPLFQPFGKYAIITGRPVSDYEDTLKFVKTRLKVPPVKIFHECQNMMFAYQYKADVLIENTEIHTYVESCSVQSQRILDIVSKHRRIKVIHFAEMISKNLKAAYYE